MCIMNILLFGCGRVHTAPATTPLIRIPITGCISIKKEKKSGIMVYSNNGSHEFNSKNTTGTPSRPRNVTCLIPRRRQNPKHRSFVFYSCIYIIEKCDNEKPSIANCMCLWLQTDQTQLLFHFPLDQPCSQGSLSCFEKDQTLVMWK